MQAVTGTRRMLQLLLLLVLMSFQSPQARTQRLKRAAVGVGRAPTIDVCQGQSANFAIPLPQLPRGVFVLFGPDVRVITIQPTAGYPFFPYLAPRVQRRFRGRPAGWMNLTLTNVDFPDGGAYNCYFRLGGGPTEPISNCGQNLRVTAPC